MSPATRDYLASLVTLWHREREHSLVVTWVEAKIKGALRVAEAERLLADVPLVSIVRSGDGYTATGPHGAISQGVTLSDALRNLAEAVEISLPDDDTRHA